MANNETDKDDQKKSASTFKSGWVEHDLHLSTVNERFSTPLSRL